MGYGMTDGDAADSGAGDGGENPCPPPRVPERLVWPADVMVRVLPLVRLCPVTAAAAVVMRIWHEPPLVMMSPPPVATRWVSLPGAAAAGAAKSRWRKAASVGALLSGSDMPCKDVG